jgi:hypothetical protein
LGFTSQLNLNLNLNLNLVLLGTYSNGRLRYEDGL